MTHPYWRSAALVKLDTAPAKPIVATVFLRPGKALVLVFNDTDEAVKVTLTMDPAALGLGGGLAEEVADLMRNEVFQLTDATHLAVTVPARNARYLAVRGR